MGRGDEQTPHWLGTGEPPTILIAEDNEVERRCLERHLRRAGYDVVVARNGAEALDILRSREVAAIVADHYMPQTSGLTLLTIASTTLPHVGRILISGSPDVDIAVEAINAGNVFRFLIKPIEPKRLLLVVRDAVEKSSRAA